MSLKGLKKVFGANVTDKEDYIKDRLYHFYKKFGFEITETEEQNSNFYGKTTLNL